MNLKTALKWHFAIFVIVALYSLWMLSRLPETVPVHWGLNGKPDRFGSKCEAVWLVPVLILANLGLALLIPKISPKEFSMERFGRTFNYVMVLVAALFAFIQLVNLQAAAGSSVPMDRMVLAGIFAFFALLGNVLGRVKRNFFVGIRTPWTLANERVWEETHREAAYLWFGGGIVGAALALLGMPMLVSVAVILVLAFFPAVRSYFLYRRMGLSL
jgi:uncharacterized membrane protein